MDWGLFLATAGWLLIPGFLANSAPVLFKGILKSWAKPIDMGKSWRGKRIFGDHKTFRGFFVGTLMAIVATGVQYWLSTRYGWAQNVTILPFDVVHWSILGGLMGFGVLAGDAIESFFKRRRGIAPGKAWFPFDQLDSLVGGFLFLAPIWMLPWQYAVFYLVAVPLLHFLSNVVAYALKLKDTWY